MLNSPSLARDTNLVNKLFLPMSIMEDQWILPASSVIEMAPVYSSCIMHFLLADMRKLPLKEVKGAATSKGMAARV